MKKKEPLDLSEIRPWRILRAFGWTAVVLGVVLLIVAAILP